MALTKAQMAERLYEEVGLNKREAKEFVDAFFEVLREALQQGRQVKLSGFGNFDLRRKNERPGRNPKTGEEIPISARTVVTFRPGQKLKERVEAYTPEAGHAGSGQQPRTPADPGQALLHHRRGQRAVRREAARAALLGDRVPLAQAGQAPRQPPLLPAPRRTDGPPDPRPAVRAGLHHRRRPPAPGGRGRPPGSDHDLAGRPPGADGARGSAAAAEALTKVARPWVGRYKVGYNRRPNRGIAQPGSALVWGTSGRRFESGYPDHQCKKAAPKGPPFCIDVQLVGAAQAATCRN